MLADPPATAVIPYVSPLILQAMATEPDRKYPWIEPVEGTLVMIDVSGFTRMSEQLAETGKEGSELLNNVLNEYFQLMLDTALAQGGSNLKFGGDALLLLFQGEAHADRAISTGLEMQRVNKKFPALRIGSERIKLRMSIGVHSGVFWSAAVGDPRRRLQHVVFGPDVNRVVAAEAEASAGEVLASDATLAMLTVGAGTEPIGQFFRIVRPGSRPPEETNHLDPGVIATTGLEAYLPPPVTWSLGAETAAASAEHRNVVVMFVHVLGLEPILAAEGPGQALSELQDYVSVLVDQTQRFGGFVAANDVYTEGVKFIVLFGAPVTTEEDSANAMRLALALQEHLRASPLRLQHRIGINGGHVFAGDIGATHRREYTVIGDEVNLSARLMSAAAVGQVIVSRKTAQLAGSGFDLLELEPVRVKGKSQPIAIQELRAELTEAAEGKAAQHGGLVGRDEEVAMLRDLCRDAEGGRAATVAITGEPGIGKSRLLAEFRQYLAMRGWEVHSSQCLPHTSGQPFEPWRQIMQSLLGLRSEDQAADRNERALSWVGDHAPEFVQVASLLNPLLGLSLDETSEVQALDEEMRRLRLFELITVIVTAAAASTPIALILEDVHDADESSVELANWLQDRLSGKTALLCLTYRPSQEPRLQAGPSVISIALQSLDDGSSGSLVREALKMPRLSEAVVSAILEKARGNPLFLEEVAYAIRQSDELRSSLETGAIQSAEQLAGVVPDRLEGVVMARIDRLSPEAREVLRAASVIGTRLDVSDLGVLLGGDLGTRVDNLLAEDMLDLEDEAGRLAFRHALFQEVAYASLPFARRRHMHHALARHIEEANADVAAVVEVLAHHYDRSGDKPKTLEFSIKAGDKAKAVFANAEAIRHYSRASGLAHENGVAAAEGIAVETSLGDVLELTGRHQEALASYGRALDLCTGIRSSRRQLKSPRPPALKRLMSRAPELVEVASDICRKVGYVCERQSDYDLALRWFEEARKSLPRGSDKRGSVYIGIAGLHYRFGKLAEAASWCRRGLRLIEESGDRAETAHAHNLFGVIYRDQGMIGRAITHRLQALGMYEELGQLAGQADTLNNLAVDYFSNGQWNEALERYQASLEIAERIGDVELVAILHNNLGEVYLYKGDLARAKVQFRATIEAAPALGNIAIAALAEANLGEALGADGQYDEARKVLGESLRAFRKIGAQYFVSDVEIRLAELHFRRNRLRESRAIVNRVLPKISEMGSTSLEGRALHLQGLISTGRGERQEAQVQLERALERFLSAGDLYREARVRLALSELLAHSPQPTIKAGARRQADRAVAAFSKLGATRDLDDAVTHKQTLR
jgi:class 3 adenylate cyclase/tetratricopeptide (TPR) repeat protein